MASTSTRRGKRPPLSSLHKPAPPLAPPTTIRCVACVRHHHLLHRHHPQCTLRISVLATPARQAGRSQQPLSAQWLPRPSGLHTAATFSPMESGRPALHQVVACSTMALMRTELHTSGAPQVGYYLTGMASTSTRMSAPPLAPRTTTRCAACNRRHHLRRFHRCRHRCPRRCRRPSRHRPRHRCPSRLRRAL